MMKRSVTVEGKVTWLTKRRIQMGFWKIDTQKGKGRKSRNNEDCEKIVNAVSLTHCDITWEDIDQVSHLYFSLPYLAR